ncbi:MAG: 16S rRNA (adenine(1518)-N(6)/adenine(1519)-N(6))-dimethyltransferase RsmA [Chloroflexota bacterium]
MTMTGTLLSRVKRLLNRYDIRPRKGLGQNFLVDEQVLSRIVSAAEISAQDVLVEVGPGLGLLTRELAGKARQVIGIELDPRLAELLRREMADVANLTIVEGDVLDYPPAELLSRHAGGGTEFKVVGNLPYYVASAVLRHYLEAAVKPSLMVVTVQKEVGQAIAATSAKASLLSLSVQLYARPQVVTIVPPSAFHPPPRVQSIVLRLDTLPAPAVEVSDSEGFFSLVRAGFTSRRKQLRNSLAQGLKTTPEETVSLLNAVGIDPRRRAETLTLGEWRAIWEKRGTPA